MSEPARFLEQFIEPVESRMIRSIWRITRDATDAEDALQNALMVLWRRRSRIARHASPPALILRICIDAARDVARRRARRRQMGPGTSFAQVANTVRQQPWIHVRTEYGNRSVHDEWYAPSRLISASRGPRSIEYHDDRLRVHETYDLGEKVVYRVPAYGHPPGG